MTRKLKQKAPSLADVFNLNPADLEQNAQGNLVAPQRARLRTYQARYWVGAVLAAIFKMLTLLFYQQIRTQDVSTAGLALVVAFGVLMSASALWCIYKALIIQLDIQEGQITATEERIYLHINQRAVYTMLANYPTLHINNLQFPVDQRTLLAFQHGAAYRVYYSKRSHTLLGAERINETNISPVNVAPEPASLPQVEYAEEALSRSDAAHSRR